MSLDRINNMLFDQPLLYHPGKAETFIRAFGPRLTGQSVTIVNGDSKPVDHQAFANGRPSAGILGDRLGRAYDRHNIVPFDVVENVAVIPIEGTLVQKGGWVGSFSGETSYQGLRTQIARAHADTIKGVVFEVDSFGGQVNGAFETAADIAALSRAKPTIAILTDYAYSAGYLLASQARTIIIPEFGGAGSIGVVMMHADFSGNLEQDGIKVTLIHAGAHKVDGNPFEPLPQDVRERWEVTAVQMRDRFAEVVGKGRRGRFSKSAALRTEAQCYDAAEARDIGLVDAVGDSTEAFNAFIAQVNQRG